MSSYFIDLSQLSLGWFQNRLQNSGLLPSRRMLLDNIEQNFKKLADAGINNMEELNQALKTKKKLEKLANELEISAEYLTVLRREAGSYLPKPFALNRLPEINPKLITSLSELGINNTKQLYEAGQSYGIDKLTADTGIHAKDLKLLLCYADLARLYGTGPVFVKVLYDCGISSVEMLRKASAEELTNLLNDYNDKYKAFNHRLTLKDIMFCVDFAELL